MIKLRHLPVIGRMTSHAIVATRHVCRRLSNRSRVVVALGTTATGCVVVHLHGLIPLFVCVTARAVIRGRNVVGRLNRRCNPARAVTGDTSCRRAFEYPPCMAGFAAQVFMGTQQFKACPQMVERSLILFLRRGGPPAAHQKQTEQHCAGAPHIFQNKKLHNRITPGDAAD